jgi:hypothetical protein
LPPPQHGRKRYFVALLRHTADRGRRAPVVRLMIPEDAAEFNEAMTIAQEHRARVAIIADEAWQADFFADSAADLLAGYRRVNFSEDT